MPLSGKNKIVVALECDWGFEISSPRKNDGLGEDSSLVLPVVHPLTRVRGGYQNGQLIGPSIYGIYAQEKLPGFVARETGCC